jgi:DNA mismatch repair protein MutS
VQRDDELIACRWPRAAIWSWSTLRGEDSPTLFSLLDSCMTGMGSRLLKTWLLEPERPCGSARAGDRAAQRSGDAPGKCAKLGRERCGAHHARIALRQVRPRELVGLSKRWKGSCWRSPDRLRRPI